MIEQREHRRLRDFNSALARLEAAAQMPDSEIVRDGLIQRFEFTNEMAWKALKEGLDEGGINVRAARREVLRAAWAARCITEPDDWSQMVDQRNLYSAHLS